MTTLDHKREGELMGGRDHPGPRVTSVAEFLQTLTKLGRYGGNSGAGVSLTEVERVLDWMTPNLQAEAEKMVLELELRGQIELLPIRVVGRSVRVKLTPKGLNEVIAQARTAGNVTLAPRLSAIPDHGISAEETPDDAISQRIKRRHIALELATDRMSHLIKHRRVKGDDPLAGDLDVLDRQLEARWPMPVRMKVAATSAIARIEADPKLSLYEELKQETIKALRHVIRQARG